MIRPAFFWDGRATSLEEQVLMPIADLKEMGMSHPAMITRLSEAGGYQRYFEEAFGSRSITGDRVATALADFVRSRKSGNAPYDRWAYGRDANALSKEAQRGSDIFFFKGNCASCHAGFNFSGRLVLEAWHWLECGDPDVCRRRPSGHQSRGPRHRRVQDPWLARSRQTRAYMHDGSLATLGDVVDFTSRRQPKTRARRDAFDPLGLSEEEKA